MRPGRAPPDFKFKANESILGYLENKKIEENLDQILKSEQIAVTRGSDEVAKPIYRAKDQRLFFNDTQYFAPVPEDVWNFHIGGYQALDKYLKSRKGRKLSLDEKENIINVVKVLRFTIDQMQAIDGIWRP